MHQLPLSLGDDLLRHDQNVALLKQRALGLCGLADEGGEVISRAYLWDALDADDADLWWCR